MTRDEIKIWNRACFGDFEPALPGDVALEKAVSFHSVTCNGGVVHGLECHAKDMPAVVDAFSVLGAPEMKALLRDIAHTYAVASRREREQIEQILDQQYHAAMSDERLTTLFTALLATKPAAFAPA